MTTPDRPCGADVVILGGGLAGLTLARQLLLYSDASVTLVDRRSELPGPNQKVGESLVQLGGYYLSKVLRLEDHLFTRHYLKYNLRFHWNTPSASNDSIEDYSASFIRTLSNIPTFQLDRNLLETQLLAINSRDERFRLVADAKNIDVEIREGGRHTVRWEGEEVEADWVVDASGRSGALRRKLDLGKKSPIDHGATWCWVDGLVDIEKLTGRSESERRLDRRRQATGHFPQFLATNHFCDEGQWFWVIPLHGKTSLGLVYDRRTVDAEQVSNGRKLIEYACRRWGALGRDLPHRRIVDEGRLLNYSYDCKTALSADGWALTGEAARFSDPLYSPATDLIAIHNTVITACVNGRGEPEFAERCRMGDILMRAMYDAYVPSYSISYDALGDQEAFTLKYTWELAIYFGFYVLPFSNDLFDQTDFIKQFLRRFAALGAINHRLQHLLSDFYQWKKANGAVSTEPILQDFYDVTPLWESEKLFYENGLSAEETLDVLDRHVARLKQFARFIAAHIAASATGDRRLLVDRAFVESIRLRRVSFNSLLEAARAHVCSDASEMYSWQLAPFALDVFLKDQPVMETMG